MRIRRYAARLLSSSGSAPSSAPPPPAASWLHSAADDCCAFCDLSVSAPQEGPDAIKHKGHIAGRVPESDVRGDERAGQVQRPSAPEVKKCKIDHGPPVNKASAGLQVPKGDSVASEIAVCPGGAGGATPFSEADAEPAGKAGPLAVNNAAIEQEVKCRASLASGASKPEFTGGSSLVNGSTTGLEVLKGMPIANEVATAPEVARRVSLDSKAGTVPGLTSIAREVKGVPCHMNESGAKMEITGRTSLVDEPSTALEPTRIVSFVGRAVTDRGVEITSPEVSGTGSLSMEGSVGPEVKGGASVVRGSTKLESAGEDYSATEAAAKPEDPGRAVDAAATLDEQQLPSCDPNIDIVRLGNAGTTVTSAMQPSQCDGAEVGVSVNTTSNGLVRDHVPAVEGGAPNDVYVTPSVSCALDIVARSIGASGRTDVICYARRRGKRKLELLEVKKENIELEDGAICDEDATLERTGRCGSVFSAAGSTDVKLADIKKELMDNSSSRKAKKLKRKKFECNIDYCRMTFKTKTELSIHKKNICTVKSCSRHFRSHSYLRRHQSIHNDDMPYKCPWDGCSMAFKLSWDRAEHFKVHAGVRPYKCTTPGCSKIYKFISDFTRHRRRCKPQR